MVLLSKGNKRAYMKNIRSLLFLFVLCFQFFSDLKLETTRKNSKRMTGHRRKKSLGNRKINHKRRIRKGKKITGRKMHGKNKKIQKSLKIVPPFPVETPIAEIAQAERSMTVSAFVELGREESIKIQNMQKPQLTESMEGFMNSNSSKIIEALTFLAAKHVYDLGLPRYVDFKLNAEDEAIKMDNVAKIQAALAEKGAIEKSENLHSADGDLLNVINYLLSQVDPKEAAEVSMFGRLRSNPNSAFSSAMKKVEDLLKLNGSDIYQDGMSKEELFEKVYAIMIASRQQLIEFMKLVDKKMSNSELSNSLKVLIEYASMSTDGYDENDPKVAQSNGISEASRLLLRSILSIYGVDVNISQYKGLIYGSHGWSMGKKVVVGLGALTAMYLLTGIFDKQIKDADKKSFENKKRHFMTEEEFNKLKDEDKNKYERGDAHKLNNKDGHYYNIKDMIGKEYKPGLAPIVSDFAHERGGKQILAGGRFVRDKAKAGYKATKNFFGKDKTENATVIK